MFYLEQRLLNTINAVLGMIVGQNLFHLKIVIFKISHNNISCNQINRRISFHYEENPSQILFLSTLHYGGFQKENIKKFWFLTLLYLRNENYLVYDIFRLFYYIYVIQIAYSTTK